MSFYFKKQDVKAKNIYVPYYVQHENHFGTAGSFRHGKP